MAYAMGRLGILLILSVILVLITILSKVYVEKTSKALKDAADTEHTAKNETTIKK